MRDDLKKAAFYLPHIGKRKLKSILALLVGFGLWQLVRLVVPGLEVHPIYIYIYGIIEMRENSEKKEPPTAQGKERPSLRVLRRSQFQV